MITLKPEEVLVSNWEGEKPNGGMWVHQPPKGVIVHHKPTNTEVRIDKHKSQHKNKHEAFTILRDLLTPFEKGDEIITPNGVGEVFSSGAGTICYYCYEAGRELTALINDVAHTEKGFAYKMREKLLNELKVLEDNYNSERDELVRELKKYD